MNKRLILVLLASIAVCRIASATTYVVGPATPGTIQALINVVAQSGDVIQLQAGTYLLPAPITINGGLSVEIRGEQDPVSGVPLTILDGRNAHSVIFTYSGNSKFVNLIMQHGAGGRGDGYGGAVYVGAGAPRFESCTIRNSSVFWFGGGAWVQGGSPTFYGCVFTGNRAENFGGGAGIGGGSPTFDNCTFTGNIACTGGGLEVYGGSPLIRNCSVTGNSCSPGCQLVAGGMMIHSGAPQVVNSQICSNSPSTQIYGGYVDLGGNCVASQCSGCTDSDGDGVQDYLDRCPGGDDRIDTNVNGIPDACDCRPDLNADGIVDGSDLGLVLALWGSGNQLADIDGSGLVNGGDLGLLLAHWGSCVN
jgi:hypothetical protein